MCVRVCVWRAYVCVDPSDLMMDWGEELQGDRQNLKCVCVCVLHGVCVCVCLCVCVSRIVQKVE